MLVRLLQRILLKILPIRIITDQISTLFFVTEQSGVYNLLKENKKEEFIYFVGNTMIDTMVNFDDQIRTQNTFINLGLKSKSYILTTMHRPATVDAPEGLNNLVIC